MRKLLIYFKKVVHLSSVLLLMFMINQCKEDGVSPKEQKLSPPNFNVSGVWTGNWTSNTYGLSGTFSTNLIQDSSILRGTISIPEISMSGAPLKGTVSGDNFTFGDIDNIITFSGTINVDSVSASGIYSYPGYDNGTWSGSKTGNTSNLIIIDSLCTDNILGFSGRDITCDNNYFYLFGSNNKINKYNFYGVLIDSIDRPGSGSYSVGLAYDGANIITGDNGWGLNKIFRIDPDGNSIFKAPGSSILSGLAFDGANLWGVSDNNGKIYKFSREGVVLDSTSWPGEIASGLTCSESNLWLVCKIREDAWLNDKIVKLNFAGDTISSFNVSGQGGLTYDGIYLWHDDNGEISQYDTAGNVISTFTAPGSNGKDLAFDGTNLWLSDGFLTDCKIYKLSITGAVLLEINSPGDNPGGLTFDGEYLWHFDGRGNKIYRINPAGANYFDMPVVGSDLQYFCSEGSYIWAMNDEDIYQIDQNGLIVNSIQTPFINSSPYADAGGIASDGVNLWVLGRSSFSVEKLYKLDFSGNVLSEYSSQISLPEPFGLTYDGTNLCYLGNRLWDDAAKIYKLSVNDR